MFKRRKEIKELQKQVRKLAGDLHYDEVALFKLKQDADDDNLKIERHEVVIKAILKHMGLDTGNINGKEGKYDGKKEG